MFSHIFCNSMFQNVSSVSVFYCSKCFHIVSCKCSIWMLHMFSHICYKCMFQMFHLFQTYISNILSGYCICCSGYTHMLQTYVLIVSPCFSMLQQVLLPMCFDSRESTRCTRRPSTTRCGPPTVEHAAGSTHVHARYAPSLPFVLGHARCALSRIRVRAL
jgi:hypothetical protein